jgi:hypothetical protein
MARVHATFVASLAHPFATAARSPVALLRIVTVAMVVMARLVSIQHLSSLIAEAAKRWSARAVSGAWQQSSSDFRILADSVGAGRIFVRLRSVG